MSNKISTFIRSFILVASVIAAAFLCGIRLLQVQVVDGANYLQMTRETHTAEQDVDAARGQIVDCDGKVLNSNKIIYNINLQRSSLVQGTENEIIYRVLTILRKNGEKWNDSLPITKTAPYQFIEDKDAAVRTMKKKLNIASYATAENCVYQLYKTYEISDKYPEDMRRDIAGVRYEMLLKDFSYENKFEFASDISVGTVLELKELSGMLAGVDITESWERQYLDGTVAPHLRGVTGAISPEKYAELKGEGYTLNDIIGISGVEQALESELRGTRGVRTITRGSDGLEISDEITEEPVAGHSVMLTIDSDLQKNVQTALRYHMDYIRTPYYKPAFEDPEYVEENGCISGAVVVLDVKTGGVLAAASEPNYDLNEYLEDYEKVLSEKYSPVFNRVTDGVYRPGSTFKTITATAGLAEGVIDMSSLISCGGTYLYYAPGYMPTCMHAHGALNVRSAVRYSCNIFFYETARRLGINRLAEWAGKFGVGKDLGFELSMKNGQMSSLELFEENGWTWNEGDIVQAGIGQCETALTPMHLAVQALTLANRGVRLEPHIVKSVYNYDFSEKLYDKQPVVAEDFSDLPNMDAYMNEIKEGMKLVAGDAVTGIANQGWLNVFDYAGLGWENVAIKTGSPQASKNVFNAAIVGFYPADDPEIAFGIMLEKGEMAKYIVANICSAYTSGKIYTQYDEDGNPISPL